MGIITVLDAELLTAKWMFPGTSTVLMITPLKKFQAHDQTAYNFCFQALIKWIEKGVDVLDAAFINVGGGSVVRSGTMVMDGVVKSLHGVNKDLRDNIRFIGKTKFTSAYINYNAATLDRHTEEDTTMTLVCAPLQEGHNSNEKSRASFNFCMRKYNEQDENTVTASLLPGMSVLFNGFFFDSLPATPW